MPRRMLRARCTSCLILIAATAACSAEEQACITARNELLSTARTFGALTAVAVLICAVVAALLLRPVRPPTPGRGVLAVLAAASAAGPAAAFGGLIAERTVELPSCGLTPFESGPVLSFVLHVLPLVLTASLTAVLLWLAGRLWWSDAG